MRLTTLRPRGNEEETRVYLVKEEVVNDLGVVSGIEVEPVSDGDTHTPSFSPGKKRCWIFKKRPHRIVEPITSAKDTEQTSSKVNISAAFETFEIVQSEDASGAIPFALDYVDTNQAVLVDNNVPESTMNQEEDAKASTCIFDGFMWRDQELNFTWPVNDTTFGCPSPDTAHPEVSPPNEVVIEETVADNSTITMVRNQTYESLNEQDNRVLALKFFGYEVFRSDPSKDAILRGYRSWRDIDDVTFPSKESKGSHLKKNPTAEGAIKLWWEDGLNATNLNGRGLAVIQHCEDSDEPTGTVESTTMEDEVSFVPSPEDVVWTELNKGCGVQTAEHFTNGVLMIPENLYSTFRKRRSLGSIPGSSLIRFSSVDSEDRQDLTESCRTLALTDVGETRADF